MRADALDKVGLESSEEMILKNARKLLQDLLKTLPAAPCRSGVAYSDSKDAGLELRNVLSCTLVNSQSASPVSEEQILSTTASTLSCWICFQMTGWKLAGSRSRSPWCQIALKG